MRHLIIVFVALRYCISALAGDYIIDTVSFKSEILNEDRKYLLFIPSEISEKDSSILLYMIDGKFSDSRFRRLANENTVEKLVGIGIVNTDRRRDLLPSNSAEIFLESISNELIPIVEKKLSVKKRILYGHSFGGSFALYAMLHEPGLFDTYIASSPTPIMDMIDSSLYLQLDAKLKGEIKFYISRGSKDMKQVRKWSDQLQGNLLELKLDSIQWKYEIYEGENHNTSDVISLINGFSY